MAVLTSAEDKNIHLSHLDSSNKVLSWNSDGVNELIMLNDGRLLMTPYGENKVGQAMPTSLVERDLLCLPAGQSSSLWHSVARSSSITLIVLAVATTGWRSLSEELQCDVTCL